MVWSPLKAPLGERSASKPTQLWQDSVPPAKLAGLRILVPPWLCAEVSISKETGLCASALQRQQWLPLPMHPSHLLTLSGVGPKCILLTSASFHLSVLLSWMERFMATLSLVPDSLLPTVTTNSFLPSWLVMGSRSSVQVREKALTHWITLSSLSWWETEPRFNLPSLSYFILPPWLTIKVNI